MNSLKGLRMRRDFIYTQACTVDVKREECSLICWRISLKSQLAIFLTNDTRFRSRTAYAATEFHIVLYRNTLEVGEVVNV